MGGAVTQNFQALLIFGGDESDFSVMVDGNAQIHQIVINFHGHAVAGKTVGNALCDFKSAHRAFKSLYVTVRKCYIYHFKPTVI